MDSRILVEKIPEITKAIADDVKRGKFCLETNNILQAGIRMLNGNSGENPGITFAGTIIYAACYEDLKYYAQEVFDFRLLYPYRKLSYLLYKQLENENIEEKITYIGRQAIVDKGRGHV